MWLKTSINSIPLFVKDKSIIPLAIKFGNNEYNSDMTDVNKQNVTGMYVKIAYDGAGEEGQQPVQKLLRTKNYVEFIVYHDDGVSNISQETLRN